MSLYLINIYSLVAGAIGAGFGAILSLPLYPLLGPALLISALSLSGVKFAISNLVRNIAFMLIGINVGAAVTPEVMQTIGRWPVAFIVLTVTVYLIIIIGQWMLVHFFGFDKKSGMLASAPGHLSFVISFGTSLNADTIKITIVQTIRLLALTMLIPFGAELIGIKVDAFFFAADKIMPWSELTALFTLSVALGFVFARFKVPAPFLMAAMLLSSAGHLLEIISGGLPQMLMIGPLIVMGTTVGSRFSGVSLKTISGVFLAGMASAIVAVLLSVIAAFSVAGFLSMPLAHVFVAFAPGGLETMIVMGAVLGANPAFVTASHVVRLFALALMLPVIMARVKSVYEEKKDPSA